MGMLLLPVMPTKVEDFEKFLGYVRDALAKTTDADSPETGEGVEVLPDAGAGPEPATCCSRFCSILPSRASTTRFGPILATPPFLIERTKVLEVMNLYQELGQKRRHADEFRARTRQFARFQAQRRPSASWS